MGYEAPKFFILAVYGKNYGEIEETGTVVFENKNNLFTKGTCYANIVFTYVADKDLKKAEQALIERGFVNFNLDDIPQNLHSNIPLIVCDRYFGITEKWYTKEAGLAIIDREMPVLGASIQDYLNKR